MRPSTGFEGLVSIDGNVASSAHILHLKGAIQVDHLKLAKNGKPATKTVGFDFTLNHDLRQRSGALTRGDVHIGKANAELTGTYGVKNNDTVLHVKLAAPGMAVRGIGRDAAGARYRPAAGFLS